MKLAHRPRIASTMIKLISKPILLPILLILVKKFSESSLTQNYSANQNLPLPQQMLPEPRSAWTGSETIHTVPSHALNASLLYTRTLRGRCQRQVLRYYVIGLRM